MQGFMLVVIATISLILVNEKIFLCLCLILKILYYINSLKLII